MSITLSALQQQRRDTASNWTSANPTLLGGEWGYETDTGKWKVGDGSTAWTSLAYVAIPDNNGLIPIDQLLLPLGSASAPSLTFTGDVNTGIYHSAADTLAFSTGGTGRLFIDSSGNVGIGTSSPSTKLQFGASEDAISWASGNGIIEAPSNLYLRSVGGSGDVLLQTSGGNVGIGTASPSYTTHVNSSGATTLGITTTSGSSEPQIIFEDTAANDYFALQKDGRALTFKPQGSEALRIDSSGNVGIGTSSPSSNLHVQEGAGQTATLNLNNSDGNGTLSQINLGYTADPDHGNIKYTGDIIFSNAANTERMRIDSSGRLGIGTSAPANILEVAGNNSAGNGTGNVQGILRINNNTTAFGSSPTAGIVFATKYRTSPNIPLDGAAIYGGKENTSDANKSFFLAFATRAESGNNGNEAMRIDSQGRVGIGTTSPSGKLTVDTVNAATNAILVAASAETGRTYGLGVNASAAFTIHEHTAASDRLVIDSSGRLLVGTSSSSVTSTQVLQGNSGSSAGNGKLLFARGTTSPANGAGLGEIAFGDSNHSSSVTILAARDGGTWTSGSSQPSRLTFSTTADGASSPTERIRLSNDGAFNSFTSGAGIRCNTTLGAVSASGSLFHGYHSSSSTTTGTLSFIVRPNGDVKNANNSYSAISDIKLKENIVDAKSQWEDLKAFQVRNYNLKSETGHQTHTQIGLIAQEVELVSPGLVSESPDLDEDGNDLGTVTKSVNYSVLYMKAVKALQEAMDRIEILEQRLTDAGL